MGEKKRLDEGELQEVSGGAIGLFAYDNYLKKDRFKDGQYQFSTGDGKWFTFAPDKMAQFDSPEAAQEWVHKKAGSSLSHVKLREEDVVEVAP